MSIGLRNSLRKHRMEFLRRTTGAAGYVRKGAVAELRDAIRLVLDSHYIAGPALHTERQYRQPLNRVEKPNRLRPGYRLVADHLLRNSPAFVAP